MSAASPSTVAAPSGGRRGAQIAAGVVLICLAALAAYAMFSGPTTVRLPAQQQVAPTRTAPPTYEPEGQERGSHD
jgi:hypothetical protein